MKNADCLLLVVLLALVTGCSRQGQRGADTRTGALPVSGSASKSGERTGGWTYQSAEHAFSLDLPSAGWKQTQDRHIADFWYHTRTGSPMLAGVTSVKKQTREQFQAYIPEFKANIEKGRDYLLKPIFEEGLTDWGNPFIYAELWEKGTARNQFIYVATAAVWLAHKRITVVTLFEGQGQMRSEFFKSIEYVDFESAAKPICLSPR
jgi:hypothetical protein